MVSGDGDEPLQAFLSSYEGEHTGIDASAVRMGVTTYCVRSFDGSDLQFSFPLLVRRTLSDESRLDPRGADGAVGAIIETIKEQAANVPALGPLYGRGTKFPLRYSDTIEPYTLIHSDTAIGTGLWKADARNYCDAVGIHVVVRGALPGDMSLTGRAGSTLTETLSALAEAICAIVLDFPVSRLEPSWLASLDQKLIREDLMRRNLVSFIADGSHLARSPSQHRCIFRSAGPRNGISIPFCCPLELQPVEMEQPASGGSVTGLGIRRREVLAIAGSNAQGKTTFLEGIIAGMDDHLPGDGRERVLTVRNACIAESGTATLGGADISMFFHALPPGVSGTVRSARGIGSGSMTMASQIQGAIARESPLLIIDEDRAAPNLLVKSCLQKDEITPLSEILAHRRESLRDTTLVFAACALDTLIARADRILVLDRHEASAIDSGKFRGMLAGSLRKTADSLDPSSGYPSPRGTEGLNADDSNRQM